MSAHVDVGVIFIRKTLVIRWTPNYYQGTGGSDHPVEGSLRSVSMQYMPVKGAGKSGFGLNKVLCLAFGECGIVDQNHQLQGVLRAAPLCQ